MNKKIASVLVGILVIGIVSAGLVGYLSNMVSGTVEVSGPVFYANSYISQQQEILDPVGIPIDVYLLSLEEKGNLKNFDINLDCTFPPGGCDARFMQFFTTKELGIDYFYDSNWEFHTNLKILDKTNVSGNCRAYAKLFRMYEDSGNGIYVELGETSLTDIIPETSLFGDMISTLNLPYTDMTLEDRFYVEYWVKCDYGIYDLIFRIGDDKTRIEVSAT